MQFLVTGGIFYWQYYLAPGPLTRSKLAYARTTALLRATFQELFVVWNCRSERRNAFRVGFLSNKFLLGSVMVSGLLTAALPFTGLFGTVPVYDPGEWLLTIGSSLVAFLILPEVFYGRRIWRWS
jgi:Ca2+-transporting ATPase